ncbi:hypothetical protein GCM10010524_03880 [Streptomyces mexicanus]
MAVCLPVRRGRFFCTGARIPVLEYFWARVALRRLVRRARTPSPGSFTVCEQGDLHRFPTLPVPVGSGPASSDRPPEGVNLGGELAGKFLRRVPAGRAAGRLDAGPQALAIFAATPCRSALFHPKSGA